MIRKFWPKLVAHLKKGIVGDLSGHVNIYVNALLTMPAFRSVLSVFFAPARYRVVKIVRSYLEVVL
jgi:hypothetical protein